MTTEDHLKLMIGSLVFQLAQSQAQVETLTTENAALKANSETGPHEL